MAPGPAAQVLNRIAERDAARRDRLTEAAADRVQQEGQDAADIERQLDGMLLAVDTQLRACLGDQASEGSAAAVAPELEKLEQYLATNAWLLPSYTLRKVEDATAALRQRLDAAQAAARPKKRFGFSARSKGQAAAAAPPTETPVQPAVPTTQSAAGSAAEPQEDSGRVLRGLRQQRLMKRDAELGGDDFNLADLQGCTVLLLGRMSALRLRGARGCCIVAGPVDGAVYLEDLVNSKVVLAAHQVRIHTSRDTALFLDVGSDPIIEHCSAMAFGPLTAEQRALLGLSDASMQSHAGAAGAERAAAGSAPAASGGTADNAGPASSGVADSTAGGAGTSASAAIASATSAQRAAVSGANHWAAVQDFNWLRSTPSPNWRMLTDVELRSALCPLPDDIDAGQ